jgi:DNA-binding response OmpR family regulator
MFVDDDEATNAFHKALSADFGLAEHVLIHSRADTALQELSQITDKNEFPELIFVDINMPKLSGHEFSLAVQKLKAYDSSRTCIALLTNSKDIKDVIKADENLVECYYWKPLNGELLEQVLEEGFGNRPPLV